MIRVAEDYLYAKIGRLVVENDVLHAQLAAAQKDEPEPPAAEQEPDQ